MELTNMFAGLREWKYQLVAVESTDVPMEQANQENARKEQEKNL
jgi:hypothetical protein